MSHDLTDKLLNMKEYQWMENGQSVLSGSLQELYNALDSAFLLVAREAGAVEYLVPPFIDAAELAKVDYLQSFPHLATLPVAMENSRDNLEHFANCNQSNKDDRIHLARESPVQSIMTPAACYHFYIQLKDSTVDPPLFLTTRANCFRREKTYSPLKRQWSFSMREIVVIGLEDDVIAYLELMRKVISNFCNTFQIETRWVNATDPFFNPATNPKYLSQKLEPVKQELIFDEDLAICSTNYHRTYFSERFNITAGGQPAHSGCIAFGLERWIYAILSKWGTDPASWWLKPGTDNPVRISDISGCIKN